MKILHSAQAENVNKKDVHLEMAMEINDFENHQQNSL